MAMKPLDGTFANNALTWGCGGLNIRATRIEGTVTTNPFVRNAKGYGSDGLIQGSTGKGILSEGRWPANVLLNEEAAELLDRQAPVSKSRRSIRRKAGSNVGNGKTMHAFKSRRLCVEGYEDEGGPSRFFYCAKASRKEKQGNKHPTVKPVRLCQHLAQLILPPAGSRKLLVPYSGSGSEMVGALQGGSDYVVGIERESEYVQFAERRLAQAAARMDELLSDLVAWIEDVDDIAAYCRRTNRDRNFQPHVRQLWKMFSGEDVKQLKVYQWDRVWHDGEVLCP